MTNLPLPERIDRRVAFVEFLKSQGTDWLTFRLKYAIQRRSGGLKRRSPKIGWTFVSNCSNEQTVNVVEVNSLGAWLASHEEGLKPDLLEHLELLKTGGFRVFGEEVFPRSWHHDARNDVTYPNGVHWSHVAEQGADLKHIWEPARFGWAFDLARLHVLDPESGAGDVFWDLVRSWMMQNPPNVGVHWMCGQEAAIRLIAITCASQAMPGLLTVERSELLNQLADATARRIEANIEYARSQRNNHFTSEAAGLLTAALYASEPRRRHLVEQATVHLCEAADWLILADGGSSQYSTNYHRVFLQGFAWSVLCLRALGLVVPREITGALTRGLDFMLAIQPPNADEACFFGPDDGARILPLSMSCHRDLRADCSLIGAVLRANHVATTADVEPLAWFGLRIEPATARAVAINQQATFRVFPDMGLVVLSSGQSVAFVRCGNVSFRCHEDDMLHVNAWVNGVQVLLDPGTHSYTPKPGEPGALGAAVDHNSPTCGQRPNSMRLGRFVLARPPDCEILGLLAEDDVVTGEFQLTNYRGERFRRSVSVRSNGVEVHDSGEACGSLTGRNWLLSEEAQADGSGLVESTAPSSRGYGTYQMVRSVSQLGADASLRVSLTPRSQELIGEKYSSKGVQE